MLFPDLVTDSISRNRNSKIICAASPQKANKINVRSAFWISLSATFTYSYKRIKISILIIS